jgi:hypothetical protein
MDDFEIAFLIASAKLLTYSRETHYTHTHKDCSAVATEKQGVNFGIRRANLNVSKYVLRDSTSLLGLTNSFIAHTNILYTAQSHD